MKNKFIILGIIILLVVIALFIFLNKKETSNPTVPVNPSFSISEKYANEESLSSWGLISIRKYDAAGTLINSEDENSYGIVMFPSYMNICAGEKCNQYEYTLNDNKLKITNCTEFKDNYEVSYDENGNMIWTIENSSEKILYIFALPVG